VSEINPETTPQTSAETPQLQGTRRNYRLLGRVFAYHLVLSILVIGATQFFPGFIDTIPVGGVNELAQGADVSFSQVDEPVAPVEDFVIVETFINATNQLDSLGYARQLVMVILGVWLLMLPVSWVHRGIHHVSTYDHSLDETTLILPGVVAAIVLVVQHSLALAFSLAGIVAGVHFRRALQDTFDALFILVAIGTGIAGGVAALEIAAVLTVFFCYSTMYVYYMGDGLEAHHSARKKELKRLRKAAEEQENDAP
jgi:hypothetical protein